MRRRNLGARGRIGLCLATALVGASIGAPAASGIFLNFDYMGHVKGEPTEQVEFNIKKTATGHRKVVRFIVSHIPYSCSDAPSGVTGSQRLDQSMPVSGGQFAGSGDWVDVTSDPVGTVSGKFRPAGVAVGDFRITGELAGAGTHCRTGLLDWRATKQ